MKRILLLLSFILLTSCSSFTVTKLNDSNRESAEGLRFFLPKPYLLVAEKDLLVNGVQTVEQNEGKTTTTTQKMAVARKEMHCSVIYLPDPNNEYAIETTRKSSSSIKLEEGWRLTGFNTPEPSMITTQQFGILSGTAGLTPGMYAIEFENKVPVLKKVKIIQ